MGSTFGSIVLTGKNDGLFGGPEDFVVAVDDAAAVGANTVGGVIVNDTLPKISLSLSPSAFHEHLSSNTAILVATSSYGHQRSESELTVARSYKGRAVRDRFHWR